MARVGRLTERWFTQPSAPRKIRPPFSIKKVDKVLLIALQDYLNDELTLESCKYSFPGSITRDTNPCTDCN